MSNSIELFAPEFKRVANQLADTIQANYGLKLKSSKRLEVLAKLFGFNSYNGYLAHQHTSLTLLTEREIDDIALVLAREHQFNWINIYAIMRDIIQQEYLVIELDQRGNCQIYPATRDKLVRLADNIESYTREVHTQMTAIDDYGDDDNWPDWLRQAVAKYDTRPFVATWCDSYEPQIQALNDADSELEYAIEALGHDFQSMHVCQHTDKEIEAAYQECNDPNIKAAIIEYCKEQDIMITTLLERYISQLTDAGYSHFYTDFKSKKPCVIVDGEIELIEPDNIEYLLEHADDAGVTYWENWSGLVHERFELIIEEDVINAGSEQHLVSAIMSLNEGIEQAFEQRFLIKTDRYYDWNSTLTQCDGDRESFINDYDQFKKDMIDRYRVAEDKLFELDCTLDVALEAFDKHYV